MTGDELTEELLQREGSTPPQLKRTGNKELAEKLLRAVKDINSAGRDGGVISFSSPASPPTIQNCINEMLRRCRENPDLQEDLYLKAVIRDIQKLKDIHDTQAVSHTLKNTKLPAGNNMAKKKRFGLF